MKKREADFTLLFRHWLKAERVGGISSAAFELKQTTSNSLPYDAVKDHQIDALLASKSSKGFLYKAPDDSRGIKPFDMFFLKRAGAYVVIKYPDFFCIIEVDAFIYSKDMSDRKSLTAAEARKIADVVEEL